jgi:hypothetical protein
VRFYKHFNQSVLMIISVGCALQTAYADVSLQSTSYRAQHRQYNIKESSLPFLSRLYANRPQILLELGGFITSPGESQDINIAGLVGDHFSVNHTNASNVLLGVGLYVDGLQTQKYRLAYGINAFYLPHTTINGNITQEQLFTNLAYHYTLSNVPVYLDAKAYFKTAYSDKFQITADIGIGPNFIRTSNVNERSLDGGVTIPDQAFSGNRTTAFSATFGLGIVFNNVFRSAPLECGYRFFYLGKSNFDKRSDQLLTRLTTGNNYANALTCAVSI